ncbi:IS3 family transposase [Oligoflexus sp.]|uniref:IS3 family transposase n=1 Tax=Oligoflexus sp. TaxID=1971216 RepID=UPI0039C91E85
MKKGDGLLCRAPEIKYAFIEKHRDTFPIVVMCEVLRVSRSGYHDWKTRVPSARSLVKQKLHAAVLCIYHSSRRTYGCPRIHAELLKEGFKCDKTRVERVMKELGIRAKTKRKFKVTTDSNHAHPVSPNLVNRDFKAVGPDRLWLTDITYIATAEGWLALLRGIFRKCRVAS